MLTKEMLLKRAQRLRKTSTDAECYLWYFLRGRHLEQYKFRRQYPIDRFIVDFVCLRKKLIIELDGGQHIEAADYDKQRTEFLESKGYKVLRFWNNEVLFNVNSVLDIILHELNRR